MGGSFGRGHLHRVRHPRLPGAADAARRAPAGPVRGLRPRRGDAAALLGPRQPGLGAPGARPNAGHGALARLEAAGHVVGLVTQNVDGLHQRAGSRGVIDLHGRLDRVVCLGCDALHARADVQAQIAERNPGWLDASPAPRQFAPDGDVELEAGIATFRPPACAACSGPLKPDVVFFGESVPKPRVAEATGIVSAADALLVVGSSLAVYSGYRFVRQAEKEGTPVAIVTLGETRGHRHAAVAVDAPLGRVLPALADALGA